MTNENKKLFAFDLDGTLLNSNQELSKDNVNALEQARKKGHLLIMVTGRNYIFSQMALKQHWSLFNYFVGCNGAIIHSINERDIFSKDNRIRYEFVLEILDEIKEVGGTIHVSTEWNVFSDYYFNEDIKVISKTMKERIFDPFPSVYNMTDEDKKSIIQISVHFEEHNVRKMQEKWESIYKDQYEFTITSKHNIDINLKNVTKLSAIKKIVSLNEIVFDNVFVFGDSQNDIKGLKYYNNTFAMKNALEETKIAAKNVIGDNNSTAIAEVILKNI